MRHSHLRHLASTYKNLAMLASARGEYRRACTLYRESLARRYDLGDQAGLAELLEGLAFVNAAAGRDAAAATLIAAAAALRERTGAMASTVEAETAARTLDTGWGLDMHAKQITVDYVDSDGVVRCGQIRPATRNTLR